MAGGWTQKAIAQVVAEERAELGVPRRSRMDPYVLAEQHGIDCFEIGELPDEYCRSAAVEHFLGERQAAWSAALVPLGSARIILENNAHSMVRRRASVGHEIGHFLLEHDFTDVLLTDDGCRHFDKKLERQADYFSRELLLPEKDAVWAGFQDWSDHQVAEFFDVSVQRATWCMSGARRIVENYRNKRSGS
jgi:hypothetical protein